MMVCVFDSKTLISPLLPDPGLPDLLHPPLLLLPLLRLLRRLHIVVHQHQRQTVVVGLLNLWGYIEILNCQNKIRSLIHNTTEWKIIDWWTFWPDQASPFPSCSPSAQGLRHLTICLTLLQCSPCKERLVRVELWSYNAVPTTTCVSGESWFFNFIVKGCYWISWDWMNYRERCPVSWHLKQVRVLLIFFVPLILNFSHHSEIKTN